MGGKLRLEMDGDSSTEQKTWQVYSLGKRNIFRLHLNESRDGFCQRKGKVIPCRGAENRKGAGINSGESGARNLEAESISISVYNCIKNYEVSCLLPLFIAFLAYRTVLLTSS